MMATTPEELSAVPGHIRTESHNRGGYFCSREGQLAPGGRCPDGCDHADHYSNDGHPECDEPFQFPLRTAVAGDKGQ